MGMNNSKKHYSVVFKRVITEDHRSRSTSTDEYCKTAMEPHADYIALFDYYKSCVDDITIRVHNKLLVLNKDNVDWWYVRNLNTNEIGYVPSNHVAGINDLDARGWYFPNISRSDAIRLLEHSDNGSGSFLIRESQRGENSLALSIIDDKRRIRHCLIKKTPNNTFYVLGKDRTVGEEFECLDDLVEYYSKNQIFDCLLQRACEKPGAFVGFKDSWEEAAHNIKLMEMVGQGQFATVYKGIWRNKYTVAVKQPKSINLMFKKELELIKQLKHNKIVNLLCICSQDETQPMLLVTEYMPNGDLLNYLRSDSTNCIGYSQIIDMAEQVALGMRYLESKKCVHRDLAARNILVGERNTVKIGDFGLAQILEDGLNYLDLSNDPNSIPVRWMAIEVLGVIRHSYGDMIKRVYTVKSDVWSFGIVLYELITKGGIPYENMTNTDVVIKVTRENYRLAKPAGLCTHAYYDTMRMCWKENAKERPSFDALYNILNDRLVNAF